MDIATFRSHYPEFASETDYPDTQIEYWASIAVLRLNTTRWGSLLAHGIELLTAHSITLAKAEASIAAKGGGAGQGVGLKSNKSAGDVSVGIDTTSTIEVDAGHYNLTNYGKQYIRLARIMGIGGAQI